MLSAYKKIDVSLFLCPIASFAKFIPRPRLNQYDKERIAYTRLVKEYRKKNIKTYWEKQTQIENDYIDNYDKQQEKKRLDDLMRFRTSIAKISYATRRNLVRFFKRRK